MLTFFYGQEVFYDVQLAIQAMAQQDASLQAASVATDASSNAEAGRLAAQANGLQQEIARLQKQVDTQSALIALAEDDLARARTIAERGFISRGDILRREETLLSRQQTQAQIEQNLDAKRSQLNENTRTAQQLQAQSNAQQANLAASRAIVAQQSATITGSRSYVLRAPVSGLVTAVTARAGQPAVTQSQIMTVVPFGSKLYAELSVPSSAIGFIKPGQNVTLAIDAFPYQRHGTISGRIATVSQSVVPGNVGDGKVGSFYPVSVELNATSIKAYGRSERLISGMTLTARIVTEKQSLVDYR